MQSPRTFWPGTLSLIFSAALAATAVGCGLDDPPAAGTGGTGGSNQGGTGGRGGSGGGNASGGAGGKASGGAGGQASGGAGGAASGGAGGNASGGAGGGNASGGTGGGGGGAGGSDGGQLPDTAQGQGPSLDECFTGLRKLATRSQLANKRSANGAYEVRMALEGPPDGIGTSGTKPWQAVRLGIVTPNRRVCFDEAALKNAYKNSHHNCSDVLSVTSDGLNFELKRPDTDADFPATTLTITGEAAVPPVTLSMASCVGTPGATCASGGPCQ